MSLGTFTACVCVQISDCMKVMSVLNLASMASSKVPPGIYYAHWRATQDAVEDVGWRWTPKRSSVIIYQLQLQIVSSSPACMGLGAEVRDEGTAQNWFFKGTTLEPTPNNKRTCPAKLKLISFTLGSGGIRVSFIGSKSDSHSSHSDDKLAPSSHSSPTSFLGRKVCANG